MNPNFLVPLEESVTMAQANASLIARDGVAMTKIVIPENATPVEHSAAEELLLHLEQITGAIFTIVPENASAPDCSRLMVGATKAARSVLGNQVVNGFAIDAILLKTSESDLFLLGHPRRGVLYAVYAFLEEVLGVRWWTGDETYVPRVTTLSLPQLDMSYQPSFHFRETYYLGAFDARFRARLRGNFSSRTRFMLSPFQMIPPELGGDHRLIYFEGRNSAYHSFYQLLPPAKYFAEHPEWYSEVEGRRTCEKAQLCLTNEEMTAELVRNALRLLRADPCADFIQISQNDGSSARCTCQDCLAVECAEGGIGQAAGPLLRFVNRVAEEIEKELPHVFIDTFAYRYTRRTPTLTKPRHNVIVRLCDIECSFVRPLEDDPANADFMADLRAWGHLAPRQIMVWDYVANFSSYMLPHPNLPVLADNIRTFARYGAAGVFEQGDALCSAGDFVRLRCWLIAHLLWKPELDEQQLIREFLAGYYHPRVGELLQRYLDFIHDRAAQSGAALRCYHTNVTDWLDLDGLIEAEQRMQDALDAARIIETGDPHGASGLTDKVTREKISIDHAMLLNTPELRAHGTVPERLRAMLNDPVAAGQAWIATCEKFDVIAQRETTRAALFTEYKQELLQKCRQWACNSKETLKND